MSHPDVPKAASAQKEVFFAKDLTADERKALAEVGREKFAQYTERLKAEFRDQLPTRERLVTEAPVLDYMKVIEKVAREKPEFADDPRPAMVDFMMQQHGMTREQVLHALQYPKWEDRTLVNQEKFDKWWNLPESERSIHDLPMLWVEDHPNRVGHKLHGTDINPKLGALAAEGKEEGYLRALGATDPSKIGGKFPDGFKYELKRTKEGIPLNPLLPLMVKAGIPLIAGPAWLWRPGENPAGDFPKLRVNHKTGKLEMLVIDRKDMVETKRRFPEKANNVHATALVGGMNEGQLNIVLGEHETREEALSRLAATTKLGARTVELFRGPDGKPQRLVNAGEPRGLLANGFFTTEATAEFLTEEQAESMQLGDGESTDELAPRWKTVTQDLLHNMFSIHGTIGMAAVHAWQEETGLVVGRDGSIGVA